MSSESDDDLLALAGAGSETEDELPSKRLKTEEVQEPEKSESPDSPEEERDPNIPPYPLQGKYKNMEDKQYLLGLPELERESILFERAEEMRSFNERLYLRRRAQQQQQQHEAKEVPAARSTRMGKSSKLQELRRQREARQRQESDESMSEPSEDDASDASMSEEEASDAQPVEWAEDEPEEKTLTVADVNKARWGKSDFSKYCHYPGFEQVIRGCFVRVSIGDGRYILGQMVELKKCEPYTFGDRRKVDVKVVVTHGGEEQAVEMGTCSDSPATAAEFTRWCDEMNAKDLSMPTKRRVQQKARETVAEKTRILTSDEIEEMVRKRQELAGPSGSNVLLQRSALEEQRQAAMDAGDDTRAAELERQIAALRSAGRRSRASGTSNALDMLSERNRRSNLQSVRKAELQAQVERRRSGHTVKVDPFSRLRTSAKLYYNNNEAPVAKLEEPEPEAKVSLTAVDKMIAGIDIELRIVI